MAETNWFHKMIARGLQSAAVALLLGCGVSAAVAQGASRMVCFERCAGAFPLAAGGRAATIYLAPQDAAALGTVVGAFADDVERVSGAETGVVSSLDGLKAADVVMVGTVGHLPKMAGVDAEAIAGKWESAVTAVVEHPVAGVARALVVEGSDRRGAAFALFTLSRQMGVSPWYWWADVPVAQHAAVYVAAADVCSGRPRCSIAASF